MAGWHTLDYKKHSPQLKLQFELRLSLARIYSDSSWSYLNVQSSNSNVLLILPEFETSYPMQEIIISISYVYFTIAAIECKKYPNMSQCFTYYPIEYLLRSRFLPKAVKSGVHAHVNLVQLIFTDICSFSSGYFHL